MAELTATEALEKYGFRLVEGKYIRFLGDKPDLSTEQWEPVDGGFRCYKRGSDWGKLDPATGLHAVPVHANEAFQNVGGLNPETHPQCFEFVWSSERIAEIYSHTGEGWRKLGDGTYVRDKG